MSGPRLSFLATANTVVRVDNINIATPDTDRTTYTYTDTNLLSRITAPGTKVWDYDYDLLDRATLVSIPNGMTSSYSYDTLGRMTTLDHKDGATVKEGWSYDFSASNNIRQIKSNVSGSGQRWDYTYDGRYRLDNAIRVNESGVPQYRESYAYDAADNMTTKEVVAYDPVLFDDFSDNNYTASPAWTVSGTWTAASGYLAYTSGGILPNASTSQTEEDFDLWFSYYLGDTSAGKSMSVRLRFDGTDIDYMSIAADQISLSSITGGTLDTNTGYSTLQSTWYDCYVKIRGTSITVWCGQQGKGLEQVLSTTSASSMTACTSFSIAGGTSLPRLDNLRIMKAKTTDNSLSDDFSDNDYTSNPAWSINSGTWSAASGYMQNTAHPTGAPAFRKNFQNGDLVAKYRYSLRSSTTSADPRTQFIFRCNDGGATNRLEVTVVKQNSEVRLSQYDNGTISHLASKLSIPANFDTDYDMQVVADGKHVEVWWAEAGNALTKIIEVDNAVPVSGPRLLFLVNSNTVARYDNIEITTPDSDTTTFTYSDANELLTTVADIGTTTFTYDTWGRQVSKVRGGYTAVNGWRYNDKLHTLTTSFPDEATSTWNFTGEGKLRSYVTGGVTTRYRYDSGLKLLNREDGSGALRDTLIHNPLASNRLALGVASGAVPASGAMAYISSDLFGVPRRSRNAGKSLVALVETFSDGHEDVRTIGSDAKSYIGHLDVAPGVFFDAGFSGEVSRRNLGKIPIASAVHVPTAGMGSASSGPSSVPGKGTESTGGLQGIAEAANKSLAAIGQIGLSAVVTMIEEISELRTAIKANSLNDIMERCEDAARTSAGLARVMASMEINFIEALMLDTISELAKTTLAGAAVSKGSKSEAVGKVRLGGSFVGGVLVSAEISTVYGVFRVPLDTLYPQAGWLSERERNIYQRIDDSLDEELEMCRTRKKQEWDAYMRDFSPFFLQFQ